VVGAQNSTGVSLTISTPILAYSLGDLTQDVLLSDPQNTDWIIWGTDGSTPAPTRKAGINLISDFTQVGTGGVSVYNSGAAKFMWSGGTPIANSVGSNPSVSTYGVNSGFQISVPADTTVKTLKLYAMTCGPAQLQLSVSDNSSADITATSVVNAICSETYSIDFQASSPGQTLTVQLLSGSESSSISLVAAILQPHLPQVSLTWPPANASYSAGLTIPVVVQAQQYVSSISSVNVSANGNNILTMATPRYSSNWSGGTPGHYTLQAQATDTAGLVGTSDSIDLDIIGGGGALSLSAGETESMIDLTSEGTADWIAFGETSSAYQQRSRKLNVIPLISELSFLKNGASGMNAWYSNGGQYSFEDGTPDLQESNITPNEIVSGITPGEGVQLTAQADTIPRTLRIYAGSYGGNVKLTAYLSDGSAPVVTAELQANFTSQSYYDFVYSAASPGQTLTVQLTIVDGGAIMLRAATLSGIPLPAQPVITSIAPTSGLVGDPVFIQGAAFGIAQGTVAFNGITAVISSWSSSGIAVFVPEGAKTGPIQVVNSGGIANSLASFVIRPNVISLVPAAATASAPITLQGTSFGMSQGTGQILFNGVPAVATTWSDTKIVAPVPVGATTGTVAVIQDGVISNTVPFTVLNADSQGSILKIRVVDTPASVNLSDSVNTDWVIWGTSNDGTPALTRKTGVNLISDVNSTSADQGVVPLNSATLSANSWGVQFGWTGGTIYPSSTVDCTQPSSVIVPASNVVQTLKLYVADHGSSGLTASISDGSSLPVTDSSVIGPGYVGLEKTYLIDLRAQTAPQIVNIVFTPGATNSCAWIEAAALQPHSPEVSILTPTDADSFTDGMEIPLGFTALQFDSSIASLQILDNQSQIFQFSDPPYSASWQAVPGHHQVQATATDANGLTSASPTVQMDIIGSGGALTLSSVALVDQKFPIDLTAEGTADWRIFSPDPTSGLQKNGVATLISHATQIGHGELAGYSGGGGSILAGGCEVQPSSGFPASPFVLGFEDATGSTSTGIVSDCYLGSSGPNSGLQFSVQSDTALRTLHVYVELAYGQGKLKAFLSDGSAPTIIDRSTQALSGQYGYRALIYTIQYRSKSPNQMLTLQWTVDDDANVSNVDAPWEVAELFAADVSGAPLYSGPSITSVTPSMGNAGTIVAITGNAFGATQESSTISFGGVKASVIKWTATEIDAVVPCGTCDGSITIVANGLASNVAAFSIPLQVQITPGSMGMIVGQSVQFNAVNAACQSVLSGVAWSLSPSGLATLTAGDQPTLTALNVGSLTLTATSGVTSGTATVQVTNEGVTSPTSGSPIGGTTNQNAVTLTDSLGHTSNYYSAMFGGSRLITASDGPGCSSCDIRGINRYGYDQQGSMASSTDAMGNTAYYSYDSFGNVLRASKTVTSSTTATTGYSYNPFNEVLTVTDPLGNTTSNSYDALGNLLSVTSPNPGGGGAVSVTQFGYDSKGELTQITNPLGNVSKLTYTSVGLIQSITDAQGNTTTYGYDGHGNRTLVVDATGNRTTFSYDAGDRLVGIVYPDSTASSFIYDGRGRRTSATDQNGKTTSYSYDDADRLISVTDPAQHTTAHSYDTESNLLSITDANGHATSFNHDDYGRVVQTTFPSGLAEYYTYDLIGNMLSKKDRKGQTIQYVYDALKRLTAKQYPDSTTAEYTYDLVGRILNVSDPTGSYGFAYDNMGRMLSSTTQYSFLAGQTLTNSYSYDAASNRTGLTAADGSTNHYVYDSANWLTTLSNSWAGQFGFSYDALNRRIQMARPNGTSTTYNYDSLSRLLGVLHGGGNDGAKYGYDNAGNRTSKQNLLTGMTENYSYDSIYELTRVVQGASTTASYNYDPVGNRLASLSVSPYQYDVSNHLSSVPSATYNYDSNGNLLSKTNSTGTTQYAWDYENRLISAAAPQLDGSTPIIRFQYDPFGRRIQKSSPSRTRYYVYDGANIVAEFNTSGGVDEHLAMQRGATVAYYQADALGSITSLSTGDAYTYDSFGNVTSRTGNVINPYRFTGREWDTETGLYYYRARYYDPSIGRFISEDPIGFKGSGTNYYAYVRNSPIGNIDPTGFVCMRCALANYEADDNIAQMTKNAFYDFARYPNAPGLLELALVHQLAKASGIVDAAAIGNMSGDAAEKSLMAIQWVAEFPPAVAAVVSEVALSELKSQPNDQIIDGLESYRNKLQKAIDMLLGMAAKEETNAACPQ
jgi:RHS repeat-associated protein